MKPVTLSFVATLLAMSTMSGGAMAQPSYADDMACRQYADAQIAPLRDQVNSQAVGNTLLGAGLGAALGAAAGGGRGAGIGAASGALFGTGGANGAARTSTVTFTCIVSGELLAFVTVASYANSSSPT